MIEVRLWGDPFAASPDARGLRATLQAAQAAGFRCGLALTAVRLRPQALGAGRTLALDDGRGGVLHLGTQASAEEVERALAAAQRAVVASAPLVVFGDAGDEAQAALEFPDACAVLRGAAGTEDVLRRLRALGAATVPGLLDDCREATMSNSVGHGVLVLGAGGASSLALPPDLDATFTALAALQHEGPLPVVVACDASAAAGVHAGAARARLQADVRRDADLGDLLRRAAVVVVVWDRDLDPALLAQALASGRAVVAPRCATTADLLPDGACLPVGGRWQGEAFRPDAPHLLAQLRRALGEPERARQIGARGRWHVLTHARASHPRTIPASPTSSARPSLVLEAPLFELSSSSLLTLATARALLRRDRVDVHLVPRGEHQVAWSRIASDAPEVLARCVRQPPPAVDLWLAAGWPPRASRPAGAHTFAVRVDWEYGALPVALSPLVVQEADAVVVHSHAVAATIAAAGRARDSIALVPHGVESDVFHPRATPLAEVVEWKRDRAALVFAGGLIWRKGFDLVLNALLHLPAALRAQTCLVVKPMGAHTSYRGFELGELLHRFRAAGAVDTLVVERDLSRAEMAGLYTAGDVYVHPYRGEGFGLPVLEALACGLPAVVTAGGSTDDFAWGGGCLRVAARQRDVELPEPCLSQPWVLEPDLGSLGAALARAVRERRELRQSALAAAPAVAMRSSWDGAAAQLEAMALAAVRQRAFGLPARTFASDLPTASSSSLSALVNS